MFMESKCGVILEHRKQKVKFFGTEKFVKY